MSDASKQPSDAETSPAGLSYEEMSEMICEQANARPWLWQRRTLSILGPSIGYPDEWIIWHHKHTAYFDTCEIATEHLKAAGFIELAEQFTGPEFIPGFWRPTDGAWAKLTDGFDGPEVTALKTDGTELALSNLAPKGHLNIPSKDEIRGEGERK